MGELVVGVDGSDGSRTALAWAVDEARLRGDDLTVVTVMPSPNVLITPAPIGEDLRAACRHRGVAACARPAGRVIAPHVTAGVAITPVALRGDTTFHALIRRATDADALIVGSRGLARCDACCSVRRAARSRCTQRPRSWSSPSPRRSSATTRSSSASMDPPTPGWRSVAPRWRPRSVDGSSSSSWSSHRQPADPAVIRSRPTCGPVRWCQDPCRTPTSWRTTTSRPPRAGATWPRACSTPSSTGLTTRCCPTRSRAP